MENKQNGSWLIAGGCMFIGMGIGWLLGSLRAGLFIGMGVGLVVVGWSAMRGPGKQ